MLIVILLLEIGRLGCLGSLSGLTRSIRFSCMRLGSFAGFVSIFLSDLTESSCLALKLIIFSSTRCRSLLWRIVLVHELVCCSQYMFANSNLCN